MIRNTAVEAWLEWSSWTDCSQWMSLMLWSASFSRQRERLQCRHVARPVNTTCNSWSKTVKRSGRMDDRCVRRLAWLETTASIKLVDYKSASIPLRFLHSDIVVGALISYQAFFLSFFLSFFLPFVFFSSATRGARWMELNHNWPHGWK